MKEFPRLHAFLAEVRNHSGNQVACSLWSFIVDTHFSVDKVSVLRDLQFTCRSAAEIPDECREEGDLARIDQRAVRDNAVYYWELFFTSSVQHSAHPA